MPECVEPILRWLQDSALGDTVRSTPFMYATIESLHILGIAVLVGPAFAFDLRLLGAGRSLVSVTKTARYLLPVSHLGLAIAVATGILLFSAQAVGVAGSDAAPWKLGLLLLAGLNVLVFHRGAYRRVDEWTDAVTAPVAARIAAIVSMTAWTGVIFAGRFLAYI
ncbi:hypothetical protein J2790_003849 [Paenarthrobacter nicotinovorans]|uniref:DUF6644 family protein n=1 Tax=Micrococcaceae TaxID=1268 RepID=UPI000876A04E|nr:MULTISPECIES: DUF6644 family protein [Micrococcaceae]MDR6438682.1 hypothetical protein [Paenarthrobacter nicotinovorans]SCZ56561.1 hypothetical protein SAMN02799638_01889 [Arthrobacter sp. UNCCL28]